MTRDILYLILTALDALLSEDKECRHDAQMLIKQALQEIDWLEDKELK